MTKWQAIVCWVTSIVLVFCGLCSFLVYLVLMLGSGLGGGGAPEWAGALFGVSVFAIGSGVAGGVAAVVQKPLSLIVACIVFGFGILTALDFAEVSKGHVYWVLAALSAVYGGISWGVWPRRARECAPRDALRLPKTPPVNPL